MNCNHSRVPKSKLYISMNAEEYLDTSKVKDISHSKAGVKYLIIGFGINLCFQRATVLNECLTRESSKDQFYSLLSQYRKKGKQKMRPLTRGRPALIKGIHCSEYICVSEK